MLAQQASNSLVCENITYILDIRVMALGKPAPSFEPKDEIAEALEIATELCRLEDPVAEPYRSKYKARETLERAKRSLENGKTTSAKSVALIDYHLGLIALAVEEKSAAQESLEKSAGAFFEGVVENVAEAARGKDDGAVDGEEKEEKTKGDAATVKEKASRIPTEALPGLATPSPLGWEYPAEAADTLMQLGLLWNSWDEPRRSLLYLLSSVAFLREASSSPAPIPGVESPSEDEVKPTKKAMVDSVPTLAGLTLEGNDPEAKTGTSKLENLLTHAYFYLAQAYGANDEKRMTKYCALTLQRQLAAARRGQGGDVSFNPAEWSRNACILAEYLARLSLHPAAGRCLVAAQAVLAGRIEGSKNRNLRGERSHDHAAGDTEARDATARSCDDAKASAEGEIPLPLPSPPTGDPGTHACDNKRKVETCENAQEIVERSTGGEHDDTEERREQQAAVHWHVAKLYIGVLQAKHQERGLLRQPGVDLAELRSAQRAERESTGYAAGELGLESLGFGDLPLCDPLAVEGSFESVRNVFKKAKSHTEKALQHYVLDGFVSAHVALHQGMSKAYLYLSSFEEDVKRRQAMCSRRAQALEPLLHCLGRKAYDNLHKELSFELGEIYEDLSYLKIARINEKVASQGEAGTSGEVRAINKLIQKAIGFFSHFIALYHGTDPNDGGAPGSFSSSPVEGMDTADVRGYLHARFARARLFGKLQFPNSKESIGVLRSSCADLAWLVENARGHISSVMEGNPTFFREELELAEEMMQLQRRNIANLERKQQQEQQKERQRGQ